MQTHVRKLNNRINNNIIPFFTSWNKFRFSCSRFMASSLVVGLFYPCKAFPFRHRLVLNVQPASNKCSSFYSLSLMGPLRRFIFLCRKGMTVSVSLKELIFSSCKFYNKGIMNTMCFQELTSQRQTFGSMTN